MLRCPRCRSEFRGAAGALVCVGGHSFDLARSGYVNLLAGRRRLPAAGGDDRVQLRRRTAFLGAGHFDFIADAVACARPLAGPSPRVLDAGCGTGHYLDRVTAGLARRDAASCQGLGIDLSKGAAELASRRHAHLAFAVADIWTPWPVHDASVDLLINVFAPKNFAETARVLHPGGVLAVAYPGPAHLSELRRAFGLLQPRGDKAERYADAARRHFGGVRTERIARRVHLEREAILDVVLMGPDARHRTAASLPTWSGTQLVTFDITLLLARAPRRRPTL
jgi:23S rRNA (guanine745-N1)-methyltransferase